METDIDPRLWKKKAMAFAIRTHRHLWGKNNEDPLAFLFNQGLSNEFAKSIYLGWNKFGQERLYENWGINRDGKFLIPPGIVFPQIENKEIKGLFILSLNPEKDRSKGNLFPVYRIPGSAGNPILMGNPENTTQTEEDLLKGLVLFQDNPDTLALIIKIL